MRVVVTRPLPEGERTAAELRAQGHEVLLTPLMRVETIAADFGGDFAAVIITSAHAVGATVPPSLLRLPLFAVGRRSAEAARAAGFADVTSADGNVTDLARLVAARVRGPVLYLAGEDRAGDLPGELAKAGIGVTTKIVYRAVALPYPPALNDMLRSGAVDAVLHFSRRSAENYVAGSRAADAALTQAHLCLSAQVAAPLLAAGAKVRVAAEPNEAALLRLLESV